MKQYFFDKRLVWPCIYCVFGNKESPNVLDVSFHFITLSEKSHQTISCRVENEQDGRLPQAYFPPTNFVKDAFEKDESVFFSKILFHYKTLRFFQI